MKEQRKAPQHGIDLLKRIDSDGRVSKYLWKLNDGEAVESVFLQHENMICGCISTQVGCSLDCVFCANARSEFVRNLTAGEIIGQVHGMVGDLPNRPLGGSFFDRILFMGMGEPLLNYQRVVEALLLIRDSSLFGSSETFLATCGVINRMYDLAQDAPWVRLWLSLSAAEQHVRAKLMPLAAALCSISELITAGEDYARITNHSVRVNYIMIEGITDLDISAKELVRLLKGRPFELQLSKLNPQEGMVGLRSSTDEAIERFAGFTRSKGIPTTVFQSKGAEILAACGQLRGHSLQV